MALKQFLLTSATAHVDKKETDVKRSADTLGFYFEGARIEGLTERQVAVRACSIDTTGSSPYRQSIVLPGLPPNINSKGSSLATSSDAPCLMIPPPPDINSDGKRGSICTILPYTGSKGSKLEPPNRQAKKYRPPQFIISPNGTLLNPEKRKNKPLSGHGVSTTGPQKLGDSSQSQTKKEKIMERELEVRNWPENSSMDRTKKEVIVKKRGRPLPYKLPEFPQYENKKITFEEIAKIRDEVYYVCLSV